MILKNVTIHKYKCVNSDQSFEIDEDITVLVGMNESGKTSVLEAIAKTNYFQKDSDFEFNLTHDYPRREKKKVDKSGDNPKAITCTYVITDSILAEIEEDLGKGIIKQEEICITTKYGKSTWDTPNTNFLKFIEHKEEELGVKIAPEKLEKIKNSDDFQAFLSEIEDKEEKEKLKTLSKYYINNFKWDNPIKEYIFREYLKPEMPKFLYYDEYFSLPSRITIEDLENGDLEGNQYKTAKALFELADIDTEEILNADDFEDFIAELEATESIISDELFKYWKTNKSLRIVFRIDKEIHTSTNGHQKIAKHTLDIRVKNKGVSLPLKNRSKGFNWFFSFLVWFKKIQEDENNNYILLLDEPGLNLHGLAQDDLLQFIEDLSQDYQVIYTTHSPFMISSERLDRVRTVRETDKGTVISDSLQEKDPNTLFPMQSALGYDIAQNLFVSPKNLLVEGIADLSFLQTMSSILELDGRTTLRKDITIVPTGGLDKVATFISLLRGSKLKIACLLDSFTNAKGKQKLDDLVTNKVITHSKVVFFDEFVEDYKKADLEDLFAKEDYLKLFNSAFSKEITKKDLNPKIKSILKQIEKYTEEDHFNHYLPANALVKKGVDADFFQKQTLDNFEKVFKRINKLFS